MRLRRAGIAGLLAVSIALAGAGCSPELAEIPGGSGSRAATTAPTPTDAATAPVGTDIDADLAACIAQSGFASRPVAGPATDPGEVTDEEIAELAARAQQLLEDQVRYDTVLAQCHAAESEPSATPTP
ncbi:hypothetical protein HQQ81_07785 [Microbacteriaceae bacterium VKM Ac-2854]|nr:hypothetical protein [Microbacteriaceae bacterium VKM Ac-2854]